MTGLDYITIEGFKSIASIEQLALRPINILIGANGSGKSNFLEAFSLLKSVREGKLEDYVIGANGAREILHFGPRTTPQIRFEIGFGGDQFAFTLKPGPDDKLLYDSKYFNFGKYVGLGKWEVFHLNDTSQNSPLRSTAKVHDNRFLRPDGSNLSAFLYSLREKEVESYQLIQSTVRRVAPFLEDFNLEPLRLNKETIKLEWRHKRSDHYFGASALSDGTLCFIFLATLFLQPKELRPSIILVDEPELGLHPAAITMLASLIKLAAMETQVIVSTQSSLLLDHFSPEDVLVADSVNGGTQLNRLDTPSLSAWLEDYSLGQLWEKNEFGGRPRPD